jgi:cytochrome c heme-lyase
MCHPSLASNDSSSAPSSGCPVMRKPASKASACPVVQKGGCGSEELNPLNMMPAPNEEPAPGQQGALATERVVSTIPNAEDGKWVYPSPQMFFNALLRKGKGEGIEEDAMDAVVAIHNNMNELTWKRVLEWEKLHCDTCESPKLVRFLGRPDELTPKAFLRYYLGFAPRCVHPILHDAAGAPQHTSNSGMRFMHADPTCARPFDRHDWTVDRCGTEVHALELSSP